MKKLNEYIIKSGIILDANDYNYIFDMKEKKTNKENVKIQQNFGSLQKDINIIFKNLPKKVQNGTELITLNLIAINSYVHKIRNYNYMELYEDYIKIKNKKRIVYIISFFFYFLLVFPFAKSISVIFFLLTLAVYEIYLKYKKHKLIPSYTISKKFLPLILFPVSDMSILLFPYSKPDEFRLNFFLNSLQLNGNENLYHIFDVKKSRSFIEKILSNSSVNVENALYEFFKYLNEQIENIKNIVHIVPVSIGVYNGPNYSVLNNILSNSIIFNKIIKQHSSEQYIFEKNAKLKNKILSIINNEALKNKLTEIYIKNDSYINHLNFMQNSLLEFINAGYNIFPCSNEKVPNILAQQTYKLIDNDLVNPGGSKLENVVSNILTPINSYITKIEQRNKEIEEKYRNKIEKLESERDKKIQTLLDELNKEEEVIASSYNAILKKYSNEINEMSAQLNKTVKRIDQYDAKLNKMKKRIEYLESKLQSPQGLTSNELDEYYNLLAEYNNIIDKRNALASRYEIERRSTYKPTIDNAKILEKTANKKLKNLRDRYEKEINKIEEDYNAKIQRLETIINEEKRSFSFSIKYFYDGITILKSNLSNNLPTLDSFKKFATFPVNFEQTRLAYELHNEFINFPFKTLIYKTNSVFDLIIPPLKENVERIAELKNYLIKLAEVNYAIFYFPVYEINIRNLLTKISYTLLIPPTEMISFDDIYRFNLFKNEINYNTISEKYVKQIKNYLIKIDEYDIKIDSSTKKLLSLFVNNDRLKIENYSNLFRDILKKNKML